MSRAQKPPKHPIQLSIDGHGTVLRLNRFNIRRVIEVIAVHNSGMQRLRSRLSFPWIRDATSGQATCERLRERKHVSDSELARYERQLNHLIIRESLALSPRMAQPFDSFVPSHGIHGSRRILCLPWNGLAFELRHVDHRQLVHLPKSSVLVTRQQVYGGYHAWRCLGTQLSGRLSERTLKFKLANFYDSNLIWELPLADLRQHVWFSVQTIGALEGFTIEPSKVHPSKPNGKQTSVDRQFPNNAVATKEMWNSYLKAYVAAQSQKAVDTEFQRPAQLDFDYARCEQLEQADACELGDNMSDDECLADQNPEFEEPEITHGSHSQRKRPAKDNQPATEPTLLDMSSFDL